MGKDKRVLKMDDTLGTTDIQSISYDHKHHCDGLNDDYDYNERLSRIQNNTQAVRDMLKTNSSYRTRFRNKNESETDRSELLIDDKDLRKSKDVSRFFIKEPHTCELTSASSKAASNFFAGKDDDETHSKTFEAFKLYKQEMSNLNKC